MAFSFEKFELINKIRETWSQNNSKGFQGVPDMAMTENNRVWQNKINAEIQLRHIRGARVEMFYKDAFFSDKFRAKTPTFYMLLILNGIKTK